MDSQLKELIETIKSEGVEQAEKQAREIVAAAEERAAEIVRAAEERSTRIIEAAREEQKKSERAATDAVRQASRDVILSVEARLTDIFRTVVTEAVEESLDRDVLQKSITAVVTAWAAGEGGEVDVVLGEADRAKLEQSLRGALAAKLAEGTEIRTSPAVRSGFRIAARDGSSYFDFTAESIAEAISAYVGPRLSATVREAARSE